jgi:NADH-quinone oxidoreductase subunit M
VVGIVYGAVVAMVQPDLKKLVAYSSVSHMGFCMLGLMAMNAQGFAGSMMTMLSHGVSTGALFLLVGVIYERTHDRTIAKLGGAAALVPVWATTFGFFVFASAGLPGLSGFVGEFLAMAGTFVVNPWAAAIAALVMVLAAAYLLWMFQRVVLGEPSAFLLGLKHHLTDMTPTEVLTLAPLGAMVVVFGLFPGILLDLIGGSVDVALDTVAERQAIAVDPLLVVIGLGILVAIIAARLLAVMRGPGEGEADEASSSLTPEGARG